MVESLDRTSAAPKGLTRREVLWTMALTGVMAGSAGLGLAANRTDFQIVDRLSPLNRRRPVRPSTRHIVLHTTEGEEEGSLSKIVRYGEAHYVVAYSGKVYRVIDKAKIAKHAGRSMWEGRSVIDNYSIGIEVVGYHDRDIRDAQYAALNELLRQLKNVYGIADEDVLTHSMVAYGRPNRFHDENHRGRKRCGMLFARPEVRARLGLDAKPDHDADVEAGRLVVADRELYRVLFARQPAFVPAFVPAKVELRAESRAEIAPRAKYAVLDGKRTPWEIARERYNDAGTVYVFPDGKRIAGNQIKEWRKIPNGTQVLMGAVDDTQLFEGFLEIGKDGASVKEIAGGAWKSDTTIYFFPDGMVRTGAELGKLRSTRKLLDDPPGGTRLLVGYVYGGYVRKRRRPAAIAGEKWNYPSTYYRYPDGSIKSGDEVDSRSIPSGAMVFYER